MRWSLNIGSLGGTEIRIHVTFLLFLIWIGAIYYRQGGADAEEGQGGHGEDGLAERQQAGHGTPPSVCDAMTKPAPLARRPSAGARPAGEGSAWRRNLTGHSG